MLTEKDKKAGIIMLICGAVFIIGIIIFRVVDGRNAGGVRGSGLSGDKDDAVTMEIRQITPTFYNSSFSDEKQQIALSQASAYDVYANLVYESEGETAISSYLAEVEALEEQKALRYDTVDYSEMINAMTSSVVGSGIPVGDSMLSDDKSVTSTFEKLYDVVPQAALMLADNSKNYGGLGNAYAYQQGSLSVSANSIDALYTNVIVPSYTEGTYSAFRVTQDGVYCIGGDDVFALFMYMDSGVVLDYINRGETLQGLLDSGVLSLDILVGEGEFAETYDSIYSLCGISYDEYYMNTLNATEMLVVIHIVNNKVYTEKYAVGNVWGITTDYDTVAETVVTEDGGELPVYEEKEVPVFTGYYCW